MLWFDLATALFLENPKIREPPFCAGPLGGAPIRTQFTILKTKTLFKDIEVSYTISFTATGIPMFHVYSQIAVRSRVGALAALLLLETITDPPVMWPGFAGPRLPAPRTLAGQRGLWLWPRPGPGHARPPSHSAGAAACVRCRCNPSTGISPSSSGETGEREQKQQWRRFLYWGQRLESHIVSSAGAVRHMQFGWRKSPGRAPYVALSRPYFAGGILQLVLCGAGGGFVAGSAAWLGLWTNSHPPALRQKARELFGPVDTPEVPRQGRAQAPSTRRFLWVRKGEPD